MGDALKIGKWTLLDGKSMYQCLKHTEHRCLPHCLIPIWEIILISDKALKIHLDISRNLQMAIQGKHHR